MKKMRKNEEERPAPAKTIEELRARIGLPGKPYVPKEWPKTPIEVLQEAYPDRDLTDASVLDATRREYDVTTSLRKIAEADGPDSIRSILTVAESMPVPNKFNELLDIIKKEIKENKEKE